MQKPLRLFRISVDFKDGHKHSSEFKAESPLRCLYTVLEANRGRTVASHQVSEIHQTEGITQYTCAFRPENVRKIEEAIQRGQKLPESKKVEDLPVRASTPIKQKPKPKSFNPDTCTKWVRSCDVIKPFETEVKDYEGIFAG
jgi:hypothetical protein